YYVAVDPSRRGEGVGAVIMDAAEAWLRRAGAPKSQLMVRDDNATARGFYLHRGYEPSEVTVLGRWLGADDAASGESRRPTPERALSVRLASDDDTATLADLRFNGRVVERGQVGLDRDAYAELMAAWTHRHRATHRAFLVEEFGVARGVAWLALLERVPSPESPRRRSGMLQNVYLAPEHRNRGLGAALVAGVVEHAWAEGLDYLMVHHSPRSGDFYRRLGFVPPDAELELRLGPGPARG
ncbi:MAG: GNAT family N-acetyltransferase, partial [Acidimicrobiales bacterium]